MKMTNNFIIKSTLTEVDQAVHSVIDEIVNFENIDDEIIFDIKLILSELLVNSLIHGNKKDPDKKIFIESNITGDELIVKIEDEGRGFDRNLVESPVAPINITKISGRGIFLVKNLSDGISFNPAGNAVTFKKILKKKESV